MSRELLQFDENNNNNNSVQMICSYVQEKSGEQINFFILNYISKLDNIGPNNSGDNSTISSFQNIQKRKENEGFSFFFFLGKV